MAPANTPRDIADRAVALATGDKSRASAADSLIKQAGGEAEPLEKARELLVRRIRVRSDDFDATAGLGLLNAALAKVGHKAEAAWRPRKWLLPR